MATATAAAPGRTGEVHPGPVHPGDRLSLREFEALPPDGAVTGDWWRVELLRGVVCVTSAPTDWHGLAQGRLWGLLEAARPPGLRVVVGPGVLGADSGMIPDLAVLRREDLGTRRRAPVLVVEVLSPGTRSRDRTTKRELYAELGIEHYWLVDTDEPSVLVLRLAAGSGAVPSYSEVAEVVGDQALLLHAPFRVTLCPAEIAAD